MNGVRYGLAALASALVWGGSAVTTSAAGSPPEVVVVNVHGALDSALQQLVSDSISSAGSSGAQAVLLDIDSPGGRRDSMDAMLQSIEQSQVPVITYVGAGAQATSAGLFVLEAADITAVAPGATLGDTQGGGDAAAQTQIAQLAQLHARNGDWLRHAVSDGAVADAQTAVSQHIVDRSAAGVQLNRFQLGEMQSLLHAAADPDIGYLLIIITLLALGLWMVHPAFFVPGAVGLLSGALALYSLTNLPINAVGALLMVLAMMLFAADVKAATHGALTAAAGIALGAGGLLLVDTTYLQPGVSPRMIVVTALPLAAWFAFVVRKVIEAKRRPYNVLGDGVLGRLGEMRADGMVRIEGVLWSARSRGPEPLDDGTPVRVVAMHGLCLDVEPLTAIKHPLAAASPAGRH